MVEMKIIRSPITRAGLKQMAREQFGDLVKAVVDIEQRIMVIGGELHADEEVLLMEEAQSKREHTWGVNLYPDKSGGEFIDFDSMINLKPSMGNRTRGVDDPAIREKIKVIIQKLVVD